MRQHLQKALYIGALLSALLYTGSYKFLAGERLEDVFVGSKGGSVWAFSGVRMRVHEFTEDPTSPFYSPDLLREERRLMRIYAPLVYLDAKLFKNYHILHDDLPEMGG